MNGLVLTVYRLFRPNWTVAQGSPQPSRTRQKPPYFPNLAMRSSFQDSGAPPATARLANGCNFVDGPFCLPPNEKRNSIEKQLE
ncbi:hypothetical protein CC2G_015293 [Coprinopsis cinerea AmutBmut pab1-1]|nr:hypothetical protein CC2G_015293 [Coprinopsis cinerea AmutBmut pab1-1]